MPELTQEELKRLLHYDPDTGVFTWKVNRGSRGKVGAIAGTLSKSTGYIQITIYNARYTAHRLAILYVEGEFPKGNVKHENSIDIDNRHCNLIKGPPIVNRKGSKPKKALRPNKPSETYSSISKTFF